MKSRPWLDRQLMADIRRITTGANIHGVMNLLQRYQSQYELVDMLVDSGADDREIAAESHILEERHRELCVFLVEQRRK